MNKILKISLIVFLVGLGFFWIRNWNVQAATAECLDQHAGYCGILGLKKGESKEIDFDAAIKLLEDDYNRNSKVLGFSYVEYSGGGAYWRCGNMRTVKFTDIYACTSNNQSSTTPPVGTIACSGANVNLTANIPWHKVLDCSVASKCAYTQKAECGSASTEKGNSGHNSLTSSSSNLCASGFNVSNFDSTMTEFDGNWTWDCVKDSYDTAHCTAMKNGECAPTPDKPYDPSDEACREGHINGVVLSEGEFTWYCGTGNAGGNSNNFSETLGAGTTLNVPADNYSKSTQCKCKAGYIYKCNSSGYDCTNKCSQTVEEKFYFMKKEIACFPHESGWITLSNNNEYNENFSKHDNGQPTTCQNKQVKCPPCGINDGESGTINETN